MSLTYTLIEDEPPARARLRRLVHELRPDATCLGEADDGDSGLELLKRCNPSVLFLDIEFPPDGAFGLLRRAQGLGLPLPPIVFATAYDHYAVEAFRWEAWDYVLKPLERDRLEATLQRVETRTASGDRPDLTALLQAMDPTHRNDLPERFTVLAKGRLKVLRWKEVSHLATENRLLFVHASGTRHVLDRTLDELERLLPPRFFRCHRGAMVDLDRVQELVPDPGGTGELRMEDGSRVPVSRDRMPDLRRRLG